MGAGHWFLRDPGQAHNQLREWAVRYQRPHHLHGRQNLRMHHQFHQTLLALRHASHQS